MTIQQIEQVAMQLPIHERIRLARQLLDSVLRTNAINGGVERPAQSNGLVGMFSGGDGMTAERVDQILAEERDRRYPVE